jgi:spore coat protein H
MDELELLMDPMDWKWFRRHVGTGRWFPAAIRAGATSIPGWVGYRGRYSRWFRKPSYEIWLPDEQPLNGCTHLHLNAGFRDPSLLRARLALDLFAAIGVPTPSSWHVWLVGNGLPLGVYTAVEAVDAAWLHRNHMPGGTIYYSVGSAGNLGLLHPETRQPKQWLAEGYEKCHPWDDDVSDLEHLIYQVTLPTDAEFEEAIARVLDVETFLRWFVGIEFTSHTDGLEQNYALIRPPGGRWLVSPWDCDGTFGRVPNGRPVSARYMPIATPRDNYLLARLLHTPRYWERYRHLWSELLAGPLAADQVKTRMQVLFQEIQQAALEDPYKLGSNSAFRRESALIERYVEERISYVRTALDLSTTPK